MQLHRRASRVLLAAMVVVWMALPVVRAEWNGAASQGFTYCFGRITCPYGELCSEGNLSLTGNCSMLCGAADGGPDTCVGAVEVGSEMPWRITANGQVSNGGSFGSEAEGTVPFASASLSVEGTKPQPTILSLVGDSTTFGDAIDLELSVFRFSGDPNVFDGVQVLSVLELVSGGIITQDDILFMASGDDLIPDFAFDVDVTGVPDEELVVFSVGHGVAPPPVPAVAPWGRVVLLVTSLLAGGWFVQRRKR